MIEHFQKIRAGLRKREDIYYPTIETVSDREKTFDFVENKYDDINVEEIVKEEIKSRNVR